MLAQDKGFALLAARLVVRVFLGAIQPALMNRAAPHAQTMSEGTAAAVAAKLFLGPLAHLVVSDTL